MTAGQHAAFVSPPARRFPSPPRQRNSVGAEAPSCFNCMPARHAQARNIVFHKGVRATRYFPNKGKENMSNTIGQIAGVAAFDPISVLNPKAALKGIMTGQRPLAAGGVSVQQLFEEQKAYFASDVTKSYEWRVEQLDRLTRMLKENNERFSEASRIDFKTALQENIFEVAACIASIEFVKSQLNEWMKPVEAPLPKFLAASGHKGIVYREPYGVTLIICPFNAPLLLSLRPAAAALSAGNPCILKLSEALLATDELLLELIPKYFEAEALSAVTGGREKVNELLQLPFDFIFLTGSVAAGKAVMRAAADRLTPVLLELGGQNPAIVDETANLPDAAKKIVWGAMAWGGQWCTSPGYAVVHQSMADAFVAECKKAVVDLYGKNPRGNPDYSRLISSDAVKRLASLIDPHKVVSG